MLTRHPLIKTIEKHISKRESVWGRWLPVIFYALNVTLWVLTGIIYEAGNLLYLTILTLPALVLYILKN